MAKKYAVMKIDDWNNLVDVLDRQGMVDDSRSIDELLISDAEVIRGQDITSGPIFHTYASTLIAFRDLLIINGGISEAEGEKLLDIADHFHHAAVEAEGYLFKRLPD